MARRELKPREAFRKKAGETLILTLDLSRWLGTGETISTVALDVITPAGLVTASTTLQVDQVTEADTTITFRALAGDYDTDEDLGELYCVEFTVTTSSGQTLEPACDIQLEGC